MWRRPTPGRAAAKKESGYEFYQAWASDTLSQMVAITFQHPTPYFDDSYAVNSVNHGPYGDALVEELIPYLEEHFRLITEPHARVLTGGSTGGWSSLALQIQHPTVFGGTWTFYPDPIDFRRFQLINIYEDENAFIVPNAAYGAPERMLQRTPEGQPLATVRQISQLEHAQGTQGPLRRADRRLERGVCTHHGGRLSGRALGQGDWRDRPRCSPLYAR